MNGRAGHRAAWIAAYAGVLLLAAGLRLAWLDQNGFGTLYYAAAVRSMSEGWHGFFFAAFDPGGFLAIDKPPVAFWIQAASVRLLGYGGLALHLPQALEGVAAVALLHHLAARRSGRAAGLLAALFLALTPIAVAVDRSNNTDAALVLAMLLAAWPLILAAERASLPLLLLSAALLGVAFTVKMAAALLVLPAFVAVYAFTAPAGWTRRIAHLLGAAAVLAGVALAWPLAVDWTPAGSRPWVDSTEGNRALELAVGHNAFDRFVRPGWLGGAARPAATVASVPAAPARLADPALASQVGWLAVLALAGLLLARDWPARLLWGGWAGGCGLVFSLAGGIFLPYYLAAMGPPLAALAALGVARLERPGRIGAALAAAAAWQGWIAWGAGAEWAAWLAAVPVAAALLALVLLFARRARAGLACGVAGLLVLPALWSLGPVLARGGATYPSARFVGSHPTAAERRDHALPSRARMVGLLQRNRGDARFLLATTSMTEAAAIIVRTGQPVMLVGGFTGVTPAIDREAFARRVAAGEVRYVLVGDGAETRRDSPLLPLLAWVRQTGREVPPQAWRPQVPDAPDEATRRRAAYLAGLRLYDLSGR
jgi:4-amino-4-deoxy-L-arabinose transferase-like glycosyltransferase